MSEQSPQEKSSWWVRLREWFRPSRGDTIVANVQDSREVIVGKNIIKVGTLVVPAVPVFIGVVVLIGVIAFGAYLYFVPAKMPANFFNVAVAEFGEMRADGRSVSTPNAQSFALMTFTNLRDELANLSANLEGLPQPVVWHDSMFPLQMRRHIGIIPGDSLDARQTAARNLADDLGAKMIVYGNLQADQSPAEFIPEFYVAPLTNEVDEIVGPYQFGSPIPVQLSSEPGSTWASSLAQDKTYIARRQALTFVTFGLMRDFHGDHEDALTYFQNALNLFQKSNDKTGEEVLHYFIGREYLFLANKKQAEGEALQAQGKSSAKDVFAQVEPLLVKAETAFDRSRELNDAYARAHFGLGAASRLRALRQPAKQRLEQPEFLNRAFSEYETALKLAQQTGEVQTQVKLRIALGTGFFLRGEAHLHNFEWAKAIDAFDESIQRTHGELKNVEGQWRSLGEVYLTLGNAYYERSIAQKQLGNLDAAKSSLAEAIKHYDQCIDLKKFDSTLRQGAAERCERYKAQASAS